MAGGLSDRVVGGGGLSDRVAGGLSDRVVGGLSDRVVGGGGAVRQGGRGAVAHRQWSTEGRLEQVLTGPEALSVGAWQRAWQECIKTSKPITTSYDQSQSISRMSTQYNRNMYHISLGGLS